jgi:hypothetical protein
MLRRLFSVLLPASTLIAAMLVDSAPPAFASATKVEGCSEVVLVGEEHPACAHAVLTPSGRLNAGVDTDPE